MSDLPLVAGGFVKYLGKFSRYAIDSISDIKQSIICLVKFTFLLDSVERNGQRVFYRGYFV